MELLTLQELSFNVIIQQFNVYAAAYSTTKDDCFKKNLLFLQRAYSKHLFTELDRIGKLEEKHLDFLLNLYLKELDVGVVLNFADNDDIIEKIIPIGHSLTELSCISDAFIDDCTYAMRSLIPHAPNVTKMCIPNICNDELLKLIASHCSQLTELDIHESNAVTGEGLKSLCLDSNNKMQVKCPLKCLYISDTPVTCDDVAVILKNIPTLQELDYSKLPAVLYSMHKEDIDNNDLSNTVKYNLINLNFSNYYESPVLLSHLKMCSELCPRVKKLAVPLTSPEELELCSLFSELENVFIDNYRMRSVLDLNKFFSLRGGKLKKLTANVCTLSISTLIENCQNLETLVLKNSQYQKVNEKITKTLKNFRNLELDTINFSNDHCTESIIALLNSSPNLESLSLLHCDFSDEIIAKFSTFSLNCNLEHLFFVFSDVGVDLLQQIVLNCNSLKSLTLENCDNISSEEIDMLKQTITASNKSIEIHFNDDQSDFSYSDYDYDFDCDGDYDVFDGFAYAYDDCDHDDDDNDEEEDDDDYDCGYVDHQFW